MISFQKYIRKTKPGFTLIEILVAIVILSIVLVSFFSFFSQSFLFTQKNFENLTAINLAQETIVSIKNNPTYFNKELSYITNFPEPEKNILNVNSSGQFNDQPAYRLQLTITKDAAYNLYEINIQIDNLGGKRLTETYHYLKGSP